MGSSPIFTEVIDVELNSGPLEESLTKLITMYQGKLKELSTTGLDAGAIGGLNVASINADLESVRTELQALTSAFLDSFGKVAVASGETGAATAGNLIDALGKVDATVSKSSKYQLDQLALLKSESYTAYADWAAAALTALENKINPATIKVRNTQDELFKFIANGGYAFEDLDAAQQQWYTKYSETIQKQIAVQERAYAEDLARFKEYLTEKLNAGKFTADEMNSLEGKEGEVAQQAIMRRLAAESAATKQMETEFQRRAAASKFYDASSDEFQQAQMKEVAQVESATKLMEADFKRRTVAANDVSVVGTDAWQQAQMKQVAIVEQATKLMEADFKQRAAAANDVSVTGSDAWQREQMRQVAMVKQATKEMEADFAQRAAASKKAATEDSGFFSGLGSQFLTLAKLQVEWKLINVAIEAALLPAQAVAATFKAGSDYLEKMETVAADLQGVLASNVKLSADQATNYKLAGEAATEVQTSIEDASIKYGIAVDTLDRGFKAFVESGGASLTHSISDTVQIVVMLGAALKASGKDADATRSMLSEYPKLLDGTISSSSKVLETLGLTKTQWMTIREEAEKHHDLLERLTPLLSQYMQVAQDSANRFDAIKATLVLIYERTAALMDQQFWPTLKQDLQEIRDYLTQNKTQIDACAAAMGDLANSVLSLVSAKDAMQGFLDVFKGLSKELLTDKYDVTTLSIGFQQLYVAMKMVNDLLDKKALSHDTDQMDALVAAKEAAKAEYDAGLDRLDHPTSGKLNQTRILGLSKDDIFTPEDTKAIDTQLLGGGKDVVDNTKPTKEAIIALKAEYESLFQQNKIAGDKEKEQIALNLASRKISVEEASRFTIDAANKEYNAQIDLIELYKRKAATVKATPASKTSFTGSLNKQEGQLEDQNDKAIAAQQQKAVTDALKTQDAGLAQMQAALKKDAAEQIAVIQARVKAGTTIVSQGLQEELAVTKAAHFAIQAVLMAEIANAGENKQLLQTASAKYDAEDAAYTAKVKENASQRTKALVTEFIESDAVISKAAHGRLVAAEALATTNRRVSQTNVEALTTTLDLARASLALADSDFLAAVKETAYAKAKGVTGKELDALIAKEDTLRASRAKAEAKVTVDAKAVVAASPIVPALQESFNDWKGLFGDFQISNKGFTDDLRGFATDLASTMTSSAAAITEASKIASGLVAAIEKGGAQGTAFGLGAAGGGLQSISADVGSAVKDGGSIASSLSTGMKSLFANAGVVGSLMSAASGLVSVISSLFTAAAQRIADSIKKAFDKTMQAYNDGSATLQATLQAVQAERTQAIAQLSNQKGGQAQLDKLLPTLDSEIATLLKQQKQIIDNFETSLQKLQLHSTVLSQTLDQWNAINKSVQDYINAGGDAAKAAAFLSESLATLKTDAANNLIQGDKDAIAKALAYNALLVQRQQLTDAYNKSKFDTLNADALERRASNAVSVGLTQKTADAAYSSSLTDLNSQISQAATEVSMYKQIYQISSDTATLKAQASALEIQSLATQLQTLKDYQSVYNSIYKNPNGTYGTSNAAGTAAPPTTTTIAQLQVNVSTTGAVDGVALAATIQSELERSGRYGTGTTYTTN